MAILSRVVAERDPANRVANALNLNADRLEIAGTSGPIPRPERIVVIAIGKASVPMACGALRSLESAVDLAVAVSKAGLDDGAQSSERLSVLETDHPVPGNASLAAGERILGMCQDLTQHDLVLMLISGGGSALIEALVDGVSLSELQQTTESLLHHGATINQLNAVRRRLSRIKGGSLARVIAPARVVNLIVSDVLGNPLHDIASGPTVPPVDDREELATVTADLELMRRLPASVRQRIDTATERSQDEFDNVLASVILDDATAAARDAAAAAERLGYRVQTIGFDFEGEACEFGRFLGTVGRHAVDAPDAFPRPIAFVGAGELTVTVRGDGSGGRNTETAIAAALELEGTDGVVVASFATDGDDGSSGFAGGVVDGSTVSRARSEGIDVYRSLHDNDTAPMLRATHGAIDVGITGTNVNDIYLLLVGLDARRVT